MPKISLRPIVNVTSSTALTILVLPRRKSGRCTKRFETCSTTAAGSSTVRSANERVSTAVGCRSSVETTIAPAFHVLNEILVGSSAQKRTAGERFILCPRWGSRRGTADSRFPTEGQTPPNSCKPGGRDTPHARAHHRATDVSAGATGVVHASRHGRPPESKCCPLARAG